MIKVTIDGIDVFVERGSTVLQACEAVGAEIPRFCYHERLSVAGNCRMCLVEIEKTPKPVASCAMPTMDGMKVFTNTPLVRKAREAVLEFLLLNHPLDCPICDQGGECDLQDQAMLFGTDRSRFYDTKRGVEDKNVGPLIKTIMTRCIHCTRCVRFATEIAGVEEFGTTGRGRETEIGTYVEKIFKSELSGNVIDLCPVGALTSKPYAFMSRPWELRTTNSIDISDGVGSNIRVDSRGTEILRILPRFNESINEEWISDKARFSYDGLRLQRIDSPYVRKNGKLVVSSWVDAFSIVSDKLASTIADVSSKPKVLGLVGESMDLESVSSFKRLFSSLGVNIDLKTKFEGTFSNDLSANYTQNTNILSIEDSDFCLLVGVDPRYEASLLNARLRKRYLEGGFHVASIGVPLDLTFPCNQVGLTQDVFVSLCEGIHPLAKEFARAEKPMIIIGSEGINSYNGDELSYQLVNTLRENLPALVNEVSGWNGINFLNKEANSVGILDLGVSEEISNKEYDFVYILGSDNQKINFGKNTFVVYQGSHGDINANIADVILPGSTFVEKNSIFTNIEGSPQVANRVLTPPGLAREDWKIITEFSRFILRRNVFTRDSIKKIRNTNSGFNSEEFSLSKLTPLIPSLLSYEINEFRNYSNGGISNSFINRYPISVNINLSKKVPYRRSVNDFYLTNSITRASVTMAECSSVYSLKNNFL